MRRVLGSLICAGLLVVGAAGCGSDGGSDSSEKPAAAETGGTGSETAGKGNDEVAAYCEAVDEYIAKVKEVRDDGGDPADLMAEGQELSKKAAALGTAGLTAEDAETVGECTQKSSEALTPG